MKRESNEQMCLLYVGKEYCQICVDECCKPDDIIEFVRVGTKIDRIEVPFDESGFLIQVVLPEKCVDTRCSQLVTIRIIRYPMNQLTREKFQNALKKGLGRAVRHVQNSPPETVREDLLHACLNSLAYDQQIEGSRAPWLFFMLEWTKDMDYYMPLIFERYFNSVQDRIRNDDQYQLFSLVCEFAKCGNKKAKAEVYRFFDRQFEIEDRDGWFYGKFSIIALDGIPGLLYVLERFGRYVPSNKNDDFFDGLYIIEYAEKEFGKEEVQAALKTEAKRNEYIKIYLEYEKARQKHIDAINLKYQNETDAEKGKRNRMENPLREMMDRFLVDDFSKYQHDKDFINNPVRFLSCWHASAPYKFRVAGIWAEEKDLEYVYQKIYETDDPIRKAILLKVFKYRSLPNVEPQLIALLDSDDKELAKSAKDALSNTKHPLIREKALALLQANPVPSNWFEGFALLENNFQMENIAVIISSLQTNRIMNDRALHDAVRYLRRMSENNPSDVFAPVLLWVYENSPCSDCRNDVVRRLLEMNQLTSEILDECRNDCHGDIRELAEKQLLLP